MNKWKFILLGIAGFTPFSSYSQGLVSVSHNAIEVRSGELEMQVDFMRKFKVLVEYPALWTELKLSGDRARSAGLISMRPQAEGGQTSPVVAEEGAGGASATVVREDVQGFQYRAEYTPLEGNAIAIEVGLKWRDSSVPPRVMFSWLAGQKFDQFWYRDGQNVKVLDLSGQGPPEVERSDFQVAALSGEDVALAFFNSSSGMGYGMIAKGLHISLSLKQRTGNLVLVDFSQAEEKREQDTTLSFVFFAGSSREELMQSLEELRLP